MTDRDREKDAAMVAREWVQKLTSGVLRHNEAKLVAKKWVQDFVEGLVKRNNEQTCQPEKPQAPTMVDLSSISEAKLLRTLNTTGCVGNDWPLSHVEQTQRILKLYEDELSELSCTIDSPRTDWLGEGSECLSQASECRSAATTPSNRVKTLRGFRGGAPPVSNDPSSRTSIAKGHSQRNGRRRVWRSTGAAPIPENSMPPMLPVNKKKDSTQEKNTSQSTQDALSKRRVWRSTGRGSQ
eukprot:gnl/MRDRNA2_/MRDRNA2_47971_c0_seq1.p1 gnl/MRDRNA2_/MRDRNA2_47971_c0~~gnl/MRDRNA2_/MRDRNA2_47971_c0_seq1.p1  ORF type:complete len:239 (-),score=40.45 gnl/MRDRNA2_/MRDRNA2_47971_c0_seq1:97-813(-)